MNNLIDLPYNTITDDIYLIYLRKSRSDGESFSPEEILARHEEELQLLAERELGARIPEDRIFREVVSGETIKDRPIMSEIMKIMESGKVKGVLVVDPQRLTRGDLLDKGNLINAFKYTNTQILTPYKSFDLNNDFDMKLFKMELDKGSDYLEYYKMIQQRGRMASVRSGQYIGNTAPYGYEKDSYKGDNGRMVHTLKPNAEEATVIELIYNLYVNESLGCTAIANKLNDMGIKPKRNSRWSAYTLTEIVKNPVYIGKIRWNYRKTVTKYKNGSLSKSRTVKNNDIIVIDGLHDAIISEDVFNAAQQRKGKNIRNRTTVEVRNPLAGLLYCGNCGRSIIYRTSNQKDGKVKYRPRYVCINQTCCKTKSAFVDDVINRVIEGLKYYIEDFEVKLENDDGSSHKIHMQIMSNLEKQLQEINEREETQYEMLENKTYTPETFQFRHAKLVKEREMILGKIHDAKLEKPKEIDFKEKIITLNEAMDALKDTETDPLIKNTLLKKCIEKIIYTSDKGKGQRWNKTVFELDIKPFI